jgi:uncharacterized protein YhjY with autotransporter beta-barrel domain
MAACLALACLPLHAQTLTFDTLVGSNVIPNGYGNLNWNNFYFLPGGSAPGTGYDAGMVSSPNIAYNGFGSPASFSATKAFTVTSLYLATVLDPQTVTFTGYNGATQVYQLQFNVTSSGPTFETLDFTDVTSVTISTSLGEQAVIDNLSGLGFGSNTSFASTPGLTANQRGIASSIDTASSGSSNAISHVTTALGSLPVTVVGGALDELSPVKVANFYSSTAFNNAAFDVQDMDTYLAGKHPGANGTFTGSNGQLDTTGLVVNDPNVDPGLQMIHSRMLAWSEPAGLVSDVPGAVLGGVDMKDTKQMKTCPACTASDKPWDFWVRGNVVLAQGFSQDDVPHFDGNTESVVAGADYRFAEHFLAGVTASYAHTDATLDTDNSSATVDSYSPGIYASYADGGGYANFIGRYSYNSYTANRNISFLGQTADSATDGHEGLLDLDGGWDFHSGAWTFGPVAGVQYTHLTVSSYTEENSDANLSVKEDQSDSLRSRLGGSVRYNFCDCGLGVRFIPHLEATWQHEFLDQDRGLTSSFTEFAGGSFTVRTPNPSRDSALVDLGLDAQVDDTITVFGDYIVQAGQDDYFGQSLQAGVRLSF